MTNESSVGPSDGLDTAHSRGAWTTDTVLVRCFDIRVDPNAIVLKSSKPPAIISTIGGVLDDVGMAGIEYAVKHCGASEVVVLIHTDCGLVKAAQKMLNGRNEEDGALERVIHSRANCLSNDPKNKTDINRAVQNNGIDLVNQILENPALKHHKFDVQLILYETVGTKDQERDTVKVLGTFAQSAVVVETRAPSHTTINPSRDSWSRSRSTS